MDEHSYLYNQGFQRTNQTFQAGNVMNYLYDNIGQLTNATGLESDLATRRLQEQFGYAYDKAWNLSSRTKNALTETFSANDVNELSTISRSGTLTVAGTTTSPAAGVNVSGTGISGSQPAAIYADSTWALTNVTPANGQNTWNASATDANGRSSQASETVNLPSSAGFSYDANGNLLSDGTRSFAYDDENELTSVWVTNAWRSDFLYDGMLRRRIRREFAWSSGAWLQTNEVHYVCDGLLVLQERWFDPQLSTPTPREAVTYTRGNDLGGDLQRAGGIGGLLARSDSTLLLGGSPSGHAYYHFDGNGNVTCLISMSNSIVALYEYDPFGNTLSKLGTLADANLYRFSSMEEHASSSLYCYAYRLYDETIQRWENRDPIGESGSANLYEFCFDAPMTVVDALGLDTYKCNRKLGGGPALPDNEILSHTFVFTTRPDGGVSATYSWGNAANKRGWNLNQPEDIGAAEEALQRGRPYANKVGDASLDPLVSKSFTQLNKKSNEHMNLGVASNCKTEASNLLNLARHLRQLQKPPAIQVPNVIYGGSPGTYNSPPNAIIGYR